MSLATISSLLLPLLSGDGTARSAEPSVVQVYDLTTSLPGGMQHGSWETLLPFLAKNEIEDQEWDAMNGSDVLVDLLRSLYGDEFEYEDRSIRFEENGRLIVQAPPAVQAKTASYLAFLESVFSASLELRIDAVELPEGAAAEPIPALLSPADADKLLARGGRAGVQTWRLRVRAGDAAGLDLTRVATLVTDYDVEIAQAAAVADPIVEDVAVGLRLFARAAPAAGGTWLSLILRRGDPLGEPVERQIPVAGQVTTQERIQSREIASSYQSVHVLNRSLSLDTYLPEGRVLAIQSAILSGTKTRVEALLLRRESGSLPVFRQITLDRKGGGAGSKLLFLNGESIVPPRCHLEAPAIPASSVPSAWRMWRPRESGRESGIWSSFGDESLDVLRDLLGSSDGDLTIRDVGPCLFLTRDPSSTHGDKPLLPGREGTGSDFLDRYAPPARIAQVSATLRRAGTAAPVARCSIPIRIGENGCIVLGTESVELADYDVEVAQSASVADSVMRIGFDGIAIRMRPAIALSGDLVVDLVARAHVRRGESREHDLGVPGLGTLDESTYDQIYAREKLYFGKAEGAVKRFVIGDASESSAGALSLEIEAVEAR